MQSPLAIAGPTRRRIVGLLAVCERIAGDGQSGIEALNPDEFDDLENGFEKSRSLWSRRLDTLERELPAEDEANERGPKKKFPHEK
jgi:hypothetical protein